LPAAALEFAERLAKDWKNGEVFLRGQLLLNLYNGFEIEYSNTESIPNLYLSRMRKEFGVIESLTDRSEQIQGAYARRQIHVTTTDEMASVRTQPTMRLHTKHRVQTLQNGKNAVYVFTREQIDQVEVISINRSSVKQGRDSSHNDELDSTFSKVPQMGDDVTFSHSVSATS
jgi:hypothetical protein